MGKNIFDIAKEYEDILSIIEDNEGEITPEIAEKLSVSEQTVKNQLGDITRRLRHEVNRKNFLFFI